MIDENKLQARAGSYRFASSGAITDKVLLDVAAQYENQLRPKFLSVPPREIAKRFASDDRLLETTKYDGEGVFIYFEGGRKTFPIFAFSSPSGRIRAGLPALDSLHRTLTAQGVKKALLRAELYLAQSTQGRRRSVSDVIRVSASGTEAELAQLRLAVFDLIMLDGKDLRTTPDFSTTWETLGRLAGTDESAPAHRAAGQIIPEREVEAVLTAKTKAGLEGLVLRRLTRTELYKIKPQLTVDAAIIGYVEGEFEGQYGVLSLLTALTYGEKKPSGHYQVLARVGSGFPDALRLELLSVLQPMRILAPLAMTDSDGRTVHFVRPQLIAELEASDLVLTSRADRDHSTQLLIWKDSAWEFAGMTSFPRLVFPTFSRLRTDKEIGSGGARTTQIAPQAVEAPSVSRGTQRQETLLRREVWTKEQKGETMVRKLVVAEIRHDPESFPFAVYWVDFSPKRKEPLKVDVSFATTADRATTLAERAIADGIAKGWVKQG
jgi:ATP-dependent DNA ligase